MENKDRILITGGAGYIGSHTAKLLHTKGYDIVVFDNLCRGHKEFVKWGEFVNGDLNNIDLIKRVICEKQIKAVIHFAAFAYVGESVESPGKYYKNNLSNTINLLNAMVEEGVNKLIFSSTCSTYGNPIEIPISETHPQCPINPYGKSKFMIEQILEDFDTAYNLKSIALRYFNAAGADPEGEIGERHDPETHLIPNVLNVALGKNDSFNIWGTDYSTKDGTCIRDYIHVNDLAEAHIYALCKLYETAKTGFYNLGTGRGYSVKEIIKAVEEITGKKINYLERSRRAGDPPILVADYNKAKAELDWTPACSDLNSIIQTAWNWHKNQEN